MTVDPIVSLLVGAFGATALTVGAGFFGAWLQARREHSRWIREQQFAVVVDSLRLVDRLVTLGGKKGNLNDEYLVELSFSGSVVALLFPTEVAQAHNAVLSGLNAMVEAELGKKDKAEAAQQKNQAVATFMALAQKYLGVPLEAKQSGHRAHRSVTLPSGHGKG